MVWASGQPLYGGRYVIEKELGKGGFGITYLARNQNGNVVVIKTLKDEVLNDPNFAEFRDKFDRDFRNEALRLALCKHPHIVQVENAFHEGSLPCIAMEYIEGEDLWKRVKRRGALEEVEALHYIQQIGEALKVIHGKGLLHRDVKPQNIIVRSGTLEAVLIDFGLAREFIPDAIQTQTLGGSNGFSPIEQYAEKAKRGEYTDVYALAATLYYLVTQKVPNPSFVRAAKVPLIPPKQLNPLISDRINLAILKGMAFESDERSQSVSEWLKLIAVGNRASNFQQLKSDLKPSANTRRILWVDDNPANNASEVAQLQKIGIDVVQVLSTSQAMQALSSTNLPFDAVISDLARQEGNLFRYNAGIALIKAIRDAGIALPIFIYTITRDFIKTQKEVLAAGGNGVAFSDEALFKLLGIR
ncbi:MAG TPA: hypothetical protein DDW76_36615 [Cyanobacteria bacterium UBA11369]|nr:hypothetical protein [Cyanobacteria bacterium UBA11371]HBE31362.1 hypothetical protein [Cyanobacteria bacterium UBA11368]HBE54130.1 hypothetical protein [Cyanobacteria bacterium UBA11369]